MSRYFLYMLCVIALSVVNEATATPVHTFLPLMRPSSASLPLNTAPRRFLPLPPRQGVVPVTLPLHREAPVASAHADETTMTQERAQLLLSIFTAPD